MKPFSKKNFQRLVCPSGSSGLFRGKEGEARRATGVVTRSKKRSRTARQIFSCHTEFVCSQRTPKVVGIFMFTMLLGLAGNFSASMMSFHFFLGRFLPRVGHAQVEALNLSSKHPKCWISKYEHSCHAK